MPRETKFFKGQRFLKWTGKDTDPALGPGHSCVLRVDPGGHIVYWTREFNRTKSKAIEYYYKFIADIVDVRKGKYAVLEQAASISQANILRECLMTIVTNVDFVNPEFHTFMSTPDESKEVDEWADYIFKLSQETRRTQRGVLFYMQKLFAPIRYASCKELITIDDIVKIIVPCESNIADSTRIHKALMASELFFGKNGIPRTSFTDEHIFDIYMAITDRREIYHIFARRTRDRKTRILPGRMELKKFKRFLNHVQRDPRQNEVIFPEECNQSVKKIIDKFNGNRKFLSEKAFAKYLLSDENVEITNYSLRFAEENMHQPLSCYFINSSHNSYLIGAQIRHARYFCANQSSSADVEMYRQILLSGCRCVELDCWDGPDGEPLITHGPTEITLIQPVLFKDVCDAIAESAFKTSVYPVCLSIENHCSPAQQARMAEIFVESFGDLLLKDPLSDVPLLADVPLPSPYKLRRKILIKGRKKIASNRDEAKVSSQYSKDLNSFDLSSLEEEIATSGERSTDNEEIVYRNTINTPEILERNSKALYEMASIAITEESMNADESTPNDPAISFNDDQKRCLTINEFEKYGSELSNLVNYLEARPSSDLKLKEKGDKCYYRMHSLAENKAIETVFNFSSLLAKHCVKQLIRVYPDGNRFNSTNYMPMFGWMVGIQMMALNFQTNGIEMQINTTMFEENGLCGYVLKPHILRDPAANINIFGDSIHSTVLANRIEIKVLSGQLLTTLSGQRSSISTYVQVDFYGLPLEQLKGRLKTKVVANNGINPVYASLKDEPFVIEKVRFPERSVVYFRLMSDRGEQLAHRVLPVHQMTNGYRHIILRNAANRPAGPASLFVHINIGFYAPPAHKALQDAFAEPLKALIKQEEMKMNFADPLNCKIEEEQVETDEVESDDEIDYDFNFVNQERKHSAFDRLKRIGHVFTRST